AVLFVDDARRNTVIDELVRKRRLEPLLLSLEQLASPTPVEARFLLHGWARLSRFERAAPFADRLADAYPGDGAVAQEAMSLHRSLSGLDPSHAARVEALANAVVPA